MMKKKPKIELPQIKHRKSGLRKQGAVWVVLYYEDDKLRSKSLGACSLTQAKYKRDSFYSSLIKQGAAYKVRKKPALERAIANPDGDDCIYELTTYKVILEGVMVIETTNKEKARNARNEYIKKNYK